MIVAPELENHPKFIGLANFLGDAGRALLILYRLWGHCQTVKRNEFWGPASVGYVERVARWKGKPGRLFEALKKPFGPEANGLEKGWIEVDAAGNVTIHGWNARNPTLVGSTKGGEATKAKSVERKAQAEAQAKAQAEAQAKAQAEAQAKAQAEASRVELNRGDESTSPPSLPSAAGKEQEKKEAGPGSESSSAAEIPRVEEMFEFFQTRGQPVTLELCAKYAKNHDRKKTWILRSGMGDPFLRNWQEELPDWQRRDREYGATSGSNGTASRAELEEELNRVEAQTQGQTRETMPGGAKRWDSLVAKEKEIRKKLGR